PGGCEMSRRDGRIPASQILPVAAQRSWGSGAGGGPVTEGRGRKGPSTTPAAPPRSPSPSASPTGRIFGFRILPVAAQRSWGGGAGRGPVTEGPRRKGPSTTPAAPPRSPSPSAAPTGRNFGFRILPVAAQRSWGGGA